jgi:hypothetical protein
MKEAARLEDKQAALFGVKQFETDPILNPNTQFVNLGLSK